jgi:hypothetical protein
LEGNAEKQALNPNPQNQPNNFAARMKGFMGGKGAGASGAGAKQ